MATPRIELDGDTPHTELDQIIQRSAAYLTRGDLDMCANFIDATEAWLSVPLSEFDHAGERFRLETKIKESRLQAAIEWRDTQMACSAPSYRYAPGSFGRRD